MRRVIHWLLALVFLASFGMGRAAAAARSRGRLVPPAGPSAAATPGSSSSKPARVKGAAARAKRQATPSSRGESGAGKLPPMVIVVTATRLPEPLGQVGTTTTVVGAPTMQAQQIRSALDALREVPGVQVAQSGSPGTLADVLIRGAQPDENLILIDGVPVNDSASSEFDLSRITTGGLQQIEVVRGAGGALYGSQAIGGVVNLITQEGSGPLKFSLLSEGGNRASEIPGGDLRRRGRQARLLGRALVLFDDRLPADQRQFRQSLRRAAPRLPSRRKYDSAWLRPLYPRQRQSREFFHRQRYSAQSKCSSTQRIHALQGRESTVSSASACSPG